MVTGGISPNSKRMEIYTEGDIIPQYSTNSVKGGKKQKNWNLKTNVKAVHDEAY